SPASCMSLPHRPPVVPSVVPELESLEPPELVEPSSLEDEAESTASVVPESLDAVPVLSSPAVVPAVVPSESVAVIVTVVGLTVVVGSSPVDVEPSPGSCGRSSLHATRGQVRSRKESFDRTMRGLAMTRSYPVAPGASKRLGDARGHGSPRRHTIGGGDLHRGARVGLHATAWATGGPTAALLRRGGPAPTRSTSCAPSGALGSARAGG